MRIHEGKYAYELEHVRDPRSGLLGKWKFTIYRVHPFEEVLIIGHRASRERAESSALRLVEELQKTAAAAL